MKNTHPMIQKIEMAFNNLLNDAIKREIIHIEELKRLIITPSPTYKLLHIFTPINSDCQNKKAQQVPIGSINISNSGNLIQRDLLFQHITKKYNVNHL